MKAKQIITLIVGITSVAFSPIAWAAGHGGGGGGFGGGGGHSGGGGFHGGGSGGGFRGGVLAVFVAAVSPPNTLEAEPGAAVVALALALPVLAAVHFAQPRIGMGALILPVEVSADQPVHSDTTTEAAARLLLGHTNSADGETNR